MAKIIKKANAELLSTEEAEALDEMIAQTPLRSDYKLVEQLTAVIQMVTLCPNGLSMLLGRVSPPTSEQINEMILSFSPTRGDLGVRVEGGQSVPHAERLIYTEETFSAVVAVCGGWAHIADVAKGWMKMFPNGWGILVDHTRWVRTKTLRVDGSSLGKIAEIHGYSVDTVRNVITTFPRELAESVLASPVNGEFDLRDINGYPAI